MNRVLMKLSEKPFAVIAHRGGSGLAPENTLLGVQRSLEVGSDLIEIDVQITLDRIAVVFHDEDLRRIAGINASIREMKYSDLSDIKINGEKIPTLEEVLSFSIDRIGVLIEVKKPGDEIHIMDLVRRLDASQWIAIISFHTEVLRNVKRLDPYTPVGIIYYKPPGEILTAKREGFEIVLPRYTLATSRSVELARRMNLKTIAWTVNDEKWFRELAARGVDGIATDYPDLGVRIKRSLSSEMYKTR